MQAVTGPAKGAHFGAAAHKADYSRADGDGDGQSWYCRNGSFGPQRASGSRFDRSPVGDAEGTPGAGLGCEQFSSAPHSCGACKPQTCQPSDRLMVNVQLPASVESVSTVPVRLKTNRTFATTELPLVVDDATSVRDSVHGVPDVARSTSAATARIRWSRLDRCAAHVDSSNRDLFSVSPPVGPAARN